MGYYRTKHNRRRVPRYRCRSCGKSLSTRTESPTAGQHKPQVNGMLMKLFCCGVTLRRSARILGVARDTAARKVGWLATQAHHRTHIRNIDDGGIITSHVQFDELETFECSKYQPIGVSFAVRAKTGEIIDIEVAKKSAETRKGKSRGWTLDHTKAACESVMATVRKCLKPGGTIATDGSRMYGAVIPKAVPGADHRPYVRSEVSKEAKDDPVLNIAQNKRANHDPLFMVNHMCAKLRADISRLARRTWATTKKLERLQDHLLIYTAFQNGYAIV